MKKIYFLLIIALWLAIAAPSFGTECKKHLIKDGETLSGLAQKYEVSVGELLQVNPQITDPDWIFAGTYLNLPFILADGEKEKTSSTQTDVPKKFQDSSLARVMAAIGLIVSFAIILIFLCYWHFILPKKDETALKSEEKKEEKSPKKTTVKKKRNGTSAIDSALSRGDKRIKCLQCGEKIMAKNMKRHLEKRCPHKKDEKDGKIAV